MQSYFQSYSEWREALTVRCGIRLTPDYARERIAALKNPSDRSTADFIKCYGEGYLKQVVAWFERAEREGG